MQWGIMGCAVGVDPSLEDGSEIDVESSLSLLELQEVSAIESSEVDQAIQSLDNINSEDPTDEDIERVVSVIDEISIELERLEEIRDEVTDVDSLDQRIASLTEVGTKLQAFVDGQPSSLKIGLEAFSAGAMGAGLLLNASVFGAPLGLVAMLLSLITGAASQMM